MSKYAYVTLLLNSDYLPGVLALAQSISQTGSQLPLILLLSKQNVSPEVYDIIQKSKYFERIINVDPYLLETRNNFELADLLKRSDLSFTFTKLNAWKLTDYDKILYLDSDMLITENIEHLFNIWDKLGVNDIIASSDSGWPDIFNSGLFLIKPSLDMFDKLLDFYRHHDSFDGADQGILNEYFNLQSHITGGNWLRLPFTYNCTLNSNYEYLPAMIRFKDSIKVFHFIGLNKPWKNHNLCYDTSYARIFNGNRDNLFQLWWKTFDSINISGYMPLDILQASGNLQPKVEPLLLTEDDVDVDDDNDDDESVSNNKSVHTRHNEIPNPFLSPVINPQDEPQELNFPTFYYKKPSTEEIVDETLKGEAWRMEEGKVDWPQEPPSYHSHEIEVVNPVDRYIAEHPIFPWEKRATSTSISRTFQNALKFEPPVYSISIMDGSENDEQETDAYGEDVGSSAGRDSSNDAKKSQHFLGFQDGSKFERYLRRVEAANVTPRKVNASEEISDLANEVQEGLGLEDQVDEALEESETELLEEDQQPDLSDVNALDLSAEDAKIEEEIEDSDEYLSGR